VEGGGEAGAVKNEKKLRRGKCHWVAREGGTGRAKEKGWGHPFMLYFWLLRVQSSERHTFA